LRGAFPHHQCGVQTQKSSRARSLRLGASHSEGLGDGQSDRERLNDDERSRVVITQAAFEHAAPVCRIVDIGLDSPGIGLHTQAEIRLGVGGKVLSFRGLRKYTLPVADIADLTGYEPGPGAPPGNWEGLLHREITGVPRAVGQPRTVLSAGAGGA